MRCWMGRRHMGHSSKMTPHLAQVVWPHPKARSLGAAQQMLHACCCRRGLAAGERGSRPACGACQQGWGIAGSSTHVWSCRQHVWQTGAAPSGHNDCSAYTVRLQASC
jgi:hypothetical protein